jgi:2,3-bisphosphoglycerate-independent phosphoglycerate mutase
LDDVLEISSRIKPSTGPLLLVVMDGVGIGLKDEWDAVFVARTPTLDRLMSTAAFRTIRAHGTAVGLPSDADMGNSEVGHNALGAGRVIEQGAKLVNKSIEDGSIFRSGAWLTAAERCTRGGALHLIGLLSDGNVHSHQEHLHALIEEAARRGFPRVYIHTLLDGRDVPETSAPIYIERLEALLQKCNATAGRSYRIASGGGRMVTTMDRYGADWRIVERGWNAHVHGIGRGFSSAMEAVETYRAEQTGIADQFLPPFVITERGRPVGAMRDGDAVIFYNFRGDRAIEISQAFEATGNFDKFDRGRVPELSFAGMTLYDGDLNLPKSYLVPPPLIDRTISEFLANSGVTQYAMSETQKFGHVTYFWNGNRSGKFDDQTETYEEILSDRIPFEQRPWMKAAEITDRTVEVVLRGAHRFVRINFANGDMVGHSGHMEATVVAVEAVDLCLARLLAAIDQVNGTLVVLADHGNADDMIERDGKGRPKFNKDNTPVRRTSHSLNPVPFIVYRPQERLGLRKDLGAAGLANVAATVLELLGFKPPAGYETSLLE